MWSTNPKVIHESIRLYIEYRTKQLTHYDKSSIQAACIREFIEQLETIQPTDDTEITPLENNAELDTIQ